MDEKQKIEHRENEVFICGEWLPLDDVVAALDELIDETDNAIFYGPPA